MAGLNVLIVGASVAGPTAAYWFAKGGANVTIIERFPSIRKGGQNIDIRTIGVTIMNKMENMEAQVRSSLYAMDGIRFLKPDGTLVGTMTATGDPNQQSLVSEYEILRGDLNKILYDMTKDNPRVKYVFGEQVTAMHHKEGPEGPITVEFKSGYPTTTYDLVVACDGATSRTRAIGLNCGVRDHTLPINCWAAYFAIDKDLINGSKFGEGTSAVGGRGVVLGHNPTGGNKAGLFGVYPKSQKDATLPFQKAKEAGDETLKKFIAETFEGVGWKTEEILEGMWDSKDFYCSEWMQVKLPSFRKGRFTLVGDAGYAPGPTGNGTSLAIGGAYVLAGEIAKHKGDIAAGLEAYEERMKPIIKEMQVVPPGIPWFMAPQTEFGISVRNFIFRLVCFGAKFGCWFSWVPGLFSVAFGKDTYDIPEYEWMY